jgi:hypothetical protein
MQVGRIVGRSTLSVVAIFQVFNQMPVAEIRSASANNIEGALKDVHQRVPELQLLIVILPDVSGQYGMHICFFQGYCMHICFRKQIMVCTC